MLDTNEELVVDKTTTRDQHTGQVITMLHSSAGETFEVELKTQQRTGKMRKSITRASLVNKHDVAC